MHAALRVALRHLLVQDAAAGRHPLHVARAERAAVAEAVAVIDVAGQHVGDGLDAAVRMPGKAGEILARAVVAEIVEQQERIEVRRVAEAERATEVHAGAFDVRLRLTDLLDGSNGHRGASRDRSMTVRRDPPHYLDRDAGRHGSRPSARASATPPVPSTSTQRPRAHGRELPTSQPILGPCPISCPRSGTGASGCAGTCRHPPAPAKR